MGLILDSSVLIASERRSQNARQALAEIAVRAAGEDVAVSVVTLIELAHGVARANTPQRKATRRQFLNELMTALPVHPVTVPVALRAGQIDGENTAQGVRVALSDLLIGVTALELGYRIATANSISLGRGRDDSRSCSQRSRKVGRNRSARFPLDHAQVKFLGRFGDLMNVGLVADELSVADDSAVTTHHPLHGIGREESFVILAQAAELGGPASAQLLLILADT